MYVERLCDALVSTSVLIHLVTAILMSEAAVTVLQDDVKLDGGIYTPACLGQSYIDRVDAAGFHFDISTIDE